MILAARLRPPMARQIRNARRLCIAPERVNECRLILGVTPEATRSDIKKSYYRLAKETHPDLAVHRTQDAKDTAGPGPQSQSFTTGVIGSPADAPDPEMLQRKFLEIQEAFEVLMEVLDGGDAGASQKRKPASTVKARTLGEVLCDRLTDEPEVAADVWEDIVTQRLTVTGQMADAIFKACSKPGCGGMPLAIRVMRQASAEQLISQQVRCSALVSLLSRCADTEDDATYELIDDITDADREAPEVLAAIGAVFCSGTRSAF